MVESIFFNPWIWIIPLILLIALVGVIIDVFYWQEFYVTPAGSMVFVILGGIYFSWILPPYDTTYYQTYRITGEVMNIEQAFNSDSGGVMSQVFILEVDGVDHLIRSSDQRLRTVANGNDVQLACTKEFRYFVTPWYDCSFGG